MKRLIICFISAFIVTFLCPQKIFAIDQNIVEFSQLYMNRADGYYNWNNTTVLNFEASDVTAGILDQKDGIAKVKCIAGIAFVDLDTLSIRELAMHPFQVIDDSTDHFNQYEEWVGKNIIGISALEYGPIENQELTKQGAYGNAVEMLVDYWNDNIDVNEVLENAVEGEDARFLSGVRYDYYLHYVNTVDGESISVIAKSKIEGKYVPDFEDTTESNQSEEINSIDNANTVTVQETPPSDFVYGSDGQQIRINAYIGTEEEVVIPSTIDNLPVTVIGEEAFSENDYIKSVVLPDGITQVGNSAFRECKNLESVSFPASLTALPKECFQYCFRLSSAEGLKNITHFGSWCFSYTRLSGNLEFKKDSVIEWGAFSRTNITGVQFKSGEIKIECDAFGDTDLQSVYIDEACKVDFLDYVKPTEYGTFYNCENLQEAIIPANVEYFPVQTFEGCKMLTIYTPEGSFASQFAKENFMAVNTTDYSDKVNEYRKTE